MQLLQATMHVSHNNHPLCCVVLWEHAVKDAWQQLASILHMYIIVLTHRMDSQVDMWLMAS